QQPQDVERGTEAMMAEELRALWAGWLWGDRGAVKQPRHESSGRWGRGRCFFFAKVEEAVMLFLRLCRLFGCRFRLVVFFSKVEEAVRFFRHGMFPPSQTCSTLTSVLAKEDTFRRKQYTFW